MNPSWTRKQVNEPHFFPEHTTLRFTNDTLVTRLYSILSPASRNIGAPMSCADSGDGKQRRRRLQNSSQFVLPLCTESRSPLIRLSIIAPRMRVSGRPPETTPANWSKTRIRVCSRLPAHKTAEPNALVPSPTHHNTTLKISGKCGILSC